MKRIIWKELVEQRYVPLAYTALIAVILIIWSVMGNWTSSHGGNLSDRLNLENAAVVLTFGLLIVGLIPGSNTVASESAQQTMCFLSSIPIAKSKIWLCKVFAGVVTMYASAISMFVVVEIIVWILFHSSLHILIEHVAPAWSNTQSEVLESTEYAAFVYIYGCLYAYSISLFSSTMTDRPIAAAGIAICIGSGLAGLWSRFHPENSYVLPLALAATAPGFLLASWNAFRTIGTYNTSMRRVSGIGVVAIWLLGLWCLGGFYFYVQNLAQLSVPAFGFFTVSPDHWYQKKYKDISLVRLGIVYGRVKIGDSYKGTILLDNSDQLGDKPPTIETSSKSVTTKLVSVSERYVDRSKSGAKKVRHESIYFMSFEYRPTMPLGYEVAVITARSSNGNPRDILQISARKTDGFFPAQRWFPNLHHDALFSESPQATSR